MTLDKSHHSIPNWSFLARFCKKHLLVWATLLNVGNLESSVIQKCSIDITVHVFWYSVWQDTRWYCKSEGLHWSVDSVIIRSGQLRLKNSQTGSPLMRAHRDENFFKQLAISNLTYCFREFPSSIRDLLHEYVWLTMIFWKNPTVTD